MAVRLGDDLGPSQAGRCPAWVWAEWRRGGQQLGQRVHALRHGDGPGVAGQQVGQVGAEHRGAGRLQPDDRQAGLRVRGEHAEQPAQPAPRPRPAARC